MSGAGPDVLLMAPEGFGGAELERALGSEPLAELRAALRAAAEAWARTVAPDAVHHAGGAEPLADTVNRMFGGHHGPLLVAWPLLPRFRRGHAAGALDDLEAGCDVVLGPVIDGGLYLLGLARPVPALLSLPEAGWQDPDVMTVGLTAARDAGIEVGLLRAERALRSPETSARRLPICSGPSRAAPAAPSSMAATSGP